MAKLSITPSSVVVTNITDLPPVVVGQAITLQPLFDKGVKDTKDYTNNVLIAELNGNTGANKIGLSTPEIVADNVGDGLKELAINKVTQGSNFTGTWQGYSPTQTNPGIQAVVDEHTIQIQSILDSESSTFATNASITSLPTESLDGKITDLEFKGLSLVNSVKNGDFSGGTTGWTTYASAISVANKILSVVSSGSDAFVQTLREIYQTGDKFFAYARTRVTNTSCLELRFADYSGVQFKSILNPIQNTWYEMYGIVASIASHIIITHIYADAATANGKVMEVDGNAGVFAINMTALGIEDFTEAQMLDLVRGGYFDGLQGVKNPILTTKNFTEDLTSSLSLSDTTLRSVDDIIKDVVYESDGEIWEQKNIAEVSLSSGLVINATNLPNSSATGKYIAYQTDGVVHYGLINGTTTLTANATIHYQLATSQLINLTEQGLVDGELMSFENGTLYNESDTFHAQNVYFMTPVNRSAQIDGLLESANSQAKMIEAKANRVNEEWIEPTLLNGWVNYGGITQKAVYMKDEFGFVHIQGLVKSGIATAFTPIFKLPDGYRPLSQNDFVVVSNDAFGFMSVSVNGDVIIVVGTNSSFVINCTFRAEA